MKQNITIAIILTFCLALNACSIMKLSQDLDQLENLGTVIGRVTTPNGTTGGVYVVLFDEMGTAPVGVNVDRLSTAISAYVFVLDTESRYTVVAFQDLNGDLKRNQGEPAAMLGQPASLTIGPDQRYEDKHLELQTDFVIPAGYDLDLAGVDLETRESLPLIAGEITSLDDPIFEHEAAVSGMWQPVSAWQSMGAGVYFLEEYDPAKIPVLFVHGVGGSPTDFRAMIKNLDHQRFQPWVYHYPSGSRLPVVAQVLKGLVDGLKRQHGFDTIFVTAHSMGGLVARSFVLLTGEDSTAGYVKLYISIATPYNGHEGAAKGVKYLPSGGVPCWLDMQPDSDFLKSLHIPLPEEVPFYLFFAHNSGGFNPLMSYSSDSVIALRSQLAPFVQDEAVRIFGYDLGHVPILSDEAMVERYESILEDRAAEFE